MGIYLKGNVWWMIKQFRGRRVEISLSTRKKKEAEKRYVDILSKITDGTYKKGPKRIPTAVEVVQRYQREVSPHHRGHDRNEAIAVYWTEDFGPALLMSEVNKSLIAVYKTKRLGGGFSC